MHVLITGGTGFIGSALCRELLAQNHRVSVLTRSRAGAEQRVPGEVNLIEDPVEFGATETPQAVVNLAGENLGRRRWTAVRKQLFVDSRVGTTKRLFEWMQALPVRPRVLVSGSAVGYYGARGDEPLTEESVPGNEYQSELCKAWEAEAQKAESLGVRVCRIRIGVVLGPDGGALAPMRLPFKLGLGGYLGSGRQWMSWIHRTDLVALILWLLNGERQSGAYNATAPEPATNREFSSALGSVLRRPAVLPMPALPLRVLVGEMSHLLLTGQKVLPARAQLEGFSFRFSTLEAALRDVLL